MIGLNIGCALRYSQGMSRSITPYPSLGKVDVWRVDLRLPRGHDLDEDLAVLSYEERLRLALRHGDVRRRFLRAHAALRRILATYEGVAPAEVKVSTPYGFAPEMCAALRISLSHSEDIALVAVAATPVGIDIESLGVAEGAGDDLEGMAEMTLSNRELQLLHESALHLRPVAWLRSWTRKEAWVKANGSGLADRILAEVDVSEETLAGHTLVDLTPADGYVGALALAYPRVRVNWKELRR